MVICIAENRKSCEVGVRFLLLSLAKYTPCLPIFLYYPPADNEFVRWISRHNLNVILEKQPIPGWKGWDVKPSALLALLESGHDEVLWIDSDIIITRNFQCIFSGLSPETIVATEEALVGCMGGYELGYLDPNGFRAKMWGFEVGRVLPFTVNSAVIRVTTKHIPLLYEWKKYLETDEYTHSQNLDWSQRPLHMISDQDILTALLASQQFSHYPIKFLRRGREIIQYMGISGYTIAERVRNVIDGLPPFIHSSKPFFQFRGPPKKERLRDHLYRLYIDISPYTLIAASFKDDVEADCPWLKLRPNAATVLKAIGLWYTPAVGLPIALLADVWWIGNRLYSITSKLARVIHERHGLALNRWQIQQNSRMVPQGGQELRRHRLIQFRKPKHTRNQ